MGVLHGYDGAEYRIICRDGAMGGTLNPLCLLTASEYRTTRGLVQSSWMATMGVLHGYYAAEYRILCRDGSNGTLNPLCLVAAGEYRTTRELVQSSWVATMGILHGYHGAESRIICRDGAMGGGGAHGGTAWLLCCRVSHYMQRWGKGGTLSPLCLLAASEHGTTRELV